MQKVPNEALFNRLQILLVFLKKKNLYKLQAVKYSFITYIWSKVDVIFVTQFSYLFHMNDVL